MGELRCEYRRDPLGIDAARPALSWVLASDQADQKQTAYQVLVASSAEALARDRGDLWDSGKVEADRSVQVLYAGRLIESRARCFWKARAWDGDGRPSAWSAPAIWTMGILAPEDWTARWISTEMKPKADAAPRRGSLKVLRAVYTARDGAGSADVTKIVSGLVKDGRLELKVEPAALGGDPAYKHVKDLVVEYELDGTRATARAVDFDQLAIPEIAPSGSDVPGPLDAPYVRRTFTLEAVPSSALATVNVMGFYELYVNGKKVGPNVMGPALCNYHKRTLYETYDLTSYLREGRNCIGLWLSRGWYWKGRDPAVQHETAIARLQLDLVVDGRPVRIGTDGAWRCRASGRSLLGQWKWNQFGGEQVDARLEEPRWADPDLDDRAWHPVAEVAGPAVPADAQKCPPMRVLDTLPAKAVEDLGGNSYRLDFGKQVTGWLRLRLRGLESGRTVAIRYADKLEPLQTYNQIDRFISAGRTNEVFQSKFNYHGFRWALVDGLPAAPRAEDAEAELVGADWEVRGGFACSSDLLNRMHEANLWTIRCLSQSGFLSDCPHRERAGYGDGQVSIESCIMNFGMQPFYDKWSADWIDGAQEEGYLPHTAPQYKLGGGGPGWGGAAQALTWRTYLYYGDARILERNLEACRRHIEAIEARGSGDVIRAYGGKWDFIGDWVPPGRGMDTSNWPPKPAAELFNNCYRLYLREQWARMADALGRQKEASVCRAELERLRPLVHEAFFDRDQQRYVLDEQSYYLMPLMTGVVPADLRPAIMKRLEDCIRVKNKGHLDTGMLGTYFLINYLMEIGRDDLVWLIVNQPDYPGWGYMLEQGATAWWEQWNAHWSQIHSCFTSLDGWFYQGLAGIRPDPAAPGFKKILIQPAFVGDLTWVKAHYDSPYGRIESRWTRDGGKVALEVTIPPNTRAKIVLPGKTQEVGPGTHRFQAELP